MPTTIQHYSCRCILRQEARKRRSWKLSVRFERLLQQKLDLGAQDIEDWRRALPPPQIYEQSAGPVLPPAPDYDSIYQHQESPSPDLPTPVEFGVPFFATLPVQSSEPGEPYTRLGDEKHLDDRLALAQANRYSGADVWMEMPFYDPGRKSFKKAKRHFKPENPRRIYELMLRPRVNVLRTAEDSADPADELSNVASVYGSDEGSSHHSEHHDEGKKELEGLFIIGAAEDTSTSQQTLLSPEDLSAPSRAHPCHPTTRESPRLESPVSPSSTVDTRQTIEKKVRFSSFATFKKFKYYDGPLEAGTGYRGTACGACAQELLECHCTNTGHDVLPDEL